MTVSINLGDAFLLNTPPYGEHLYIAIAKTSANKYLFVNVTSRRENSETTLPAFLILLLNYLLLFVESR